MVKKDFETDTASNVGREAIARRAYEIWESEGRPEGQAMEHWFRAVSELKGQSDSASRAGAPTKPQRSPRRSAPRLNEGRFQTTQ
jgi:hypothetical protein